MELQDITSEKHSFDEASVCQQATGITWVRFWGFTVGVGVGISQSLGTLQLQQLYKDYKMFYLRKTSTGLSGWEFRVEGRCSGLCLNAIVQTLRGGNRGATTAMQASYQIHSLRMPSFTVLA